MHSAVGQFVFWFMITFSPAPFVGLGTYWLVHGKEATPEVAPTSRPNYGPPPEREFSDAPAEIEYPEVPEQRPHEPDAGPQYEAEGSGPQRRAREIEISPKPKRERDRPDV